MTDTNQLSSLSQLWLNLKEAEKSAVDARRDVENELLSLLGIAENHDGTVTSDTDEGYSIKVQCGITRKIDSDLLQELAKENGLTEHLSTLFRWKPEINSAIWKATSKDITKPLLDAITSKPAKPSFSITVK